VRAATWPYISIAPSILLFTFLPSCQICRPRLPHSSQPIESHALRFGIMSAQSRPASVGPPNGNMNAPHGQGPPPPPPGQQSQNLNQIVSLNLCNRAVLFTFSCPTSIDVTCPRRCHVKATLQSRGHETSPFPTVFSGRPPEHYKMYPNLPQEPPSHRADSPQQAPATMSHRAQHPYVPIVDGVNLLERDKRSAVRMEWS